MVFEKSVYRGLETYFHISTIITITPISYRYRGEGGANLVVSVPGKKTVVRFAKSKYAGKDQVRFSVSLITVSALLCLVLFAL